MTGALSRPARSGVNHPQITHPAWPLICADMENLSDIYAQLFPSWQRPIVDGPRHPRPHPGTSPMPIIQIKFATP
ncbi:hypothetical protein, partial [Streptococcus pneumoniae]|uniref:hypothetical protein n=1 Tax=Streptococcus pneumoniae TaxID=1313 RepID=UPI001954AFB4